MSQNELILCLSGDDDIPYGSRIVLHPTAFMPPHKHAEVADDIVSGLNHTVTYVVTYSDLFVFRIKQLIAAKILGHEQVSLILDGERFGFDPEGFLLDMGKSRRFFGVGLDMARMLLHIREGLASTSLGGGSGLDNRTEHR